MKYLLSTLILLSGLGVLIFSTLALLEKVDGLWSAGLCLVLFVAFSMGYEWVIRKGRG